MDARDWFAVSGAVGAATTANALRPFGRRSPLSALNLPSSLPASELPLQVLALQLGIGAAIARRGARGVQGLVGVGLTAASAAGLWRLQRDAAQSAEVFEAALRDALGHDYRDRITEPFSPEPDAPVTRRSLSLSDLRPPRRWVATSDLAYGEFGRRNQLDIWRRTDLPADARAPVLVQVHGGAWVFGEKRGQAQPLLSHLAERGWVCVVINYRLSPRATWPDHIVDVKRALAWTRAHVADHGGDPGFLAITGGSAGGHLAALAALTPHVAAFQPGFEDADTSVSAAVPLYGVYDFTNRDGTAGKALGPHLERQVLKSRLADDRATWEQASPMSHVGPQAPPFFTIHGTNDTIVPVEQARSFARMLRAASGHPAAYAELPRAQHAFDVLPSVRTRHMVLAVERFLAVIRSEHGGRTPADAVSDEPTDSKLRG